MNSAMCGASGTSKVLRHDLEPATCIGHPFARPMSIIPAEREMPVSDQVKVLL
jgi:hypothetical protein